MRENLKKQRNLKIKKILQVYRQMLKMYKKYFKNIEKYRLYIDFYFWIAHSPIQSEASIIIWNNRSKYLLMHSVIVFSE